ncbi:MAG: PLDc N-terminal domain-containing protein [Deltaproteobacteria bacterium]|nr:PLDc N-terminal domain-containing protein [Deltaproteobacteria bacterium]
MKFHTLLFIFFVLFIPTLWSIVHVAYRDFGSIKKKALWGCFVVFVPPIGGIVYLVVYYIGKIRSRQ